MDRKVGINQTSSINYVERTTTNSIGRYFMVSFTYALNKHINPMGMRRGGPMMRISVKDLVYMQCLIYSEVCYSPGQCQLSRIHNRRR